MLCCIRNITASPHLGKLVLISTVIEVSISNQNTILIGVMRRENIIPGKEKESFFVLLLIKII